MNADLLLSVFLSLLLLSHSFAHSDSQSNGNGPSFGSVMRYFGESEAGYGLPSSGLFDDLDNSPQQQVSMCLPNFEVSVGSIIRTKDSQTLGAHYLNETDLGAKSRDECLRLCCKVPKCNVAVFEEKNSGSCYLFDCGSLEDFRCKFTSQNHYVSAILRRRDSSSPQHNNNNSPEHSSSNAGASIMGAHINSHSHNQHEDELSQLRETDKTPVAAMAVAVAPALDGNKSKQTGEITHASSSTTSSSTPSPAGLPNINSGSPRCSRWQFECKSSGECIAIYNVCDQIPNCPDGSDEGPELHCPPSNAYSAGVGDASTNAKKQKELTPSSMLMSPQEQPKSSQQQMHHPQPPVPINGAEKIGLNANGPGVLSNGIKSQNEQSSKIFSHTDGGIMDEAFGNHQQQPLHNYGPFWKQSPNYDYTNAELQPGNNFGPLPAPPQYPNGGVQYGNGQNYGNAGYQYRGYTNMQGSPQQPPPQGLPMVPQGQPQYPSVNNNNNYNLQSNSHQQQQTYYNNPPQGISNNAMAPVSAQASGQPSNIQNGGTSQVSNAVIPFIPSNAQGVPLPTTSKPNTNQQGAQPNSNNNSNTSNGKTSLSKLESEFIKSLKVQSLQGGSSDVQSEELSPHAAGAGAVFIFILGLGMSIIMVIIVGCRLRRVGRRQRGKNRLDPDYLVDGMYL